MKAEKLGAGYIGGWGGNGASGWLTCCGRVGQVDQVRCLPMGYSVIITFLNNIFGYYFSCVCARIIDAFYVLMPLKQAVSTNTCCSYNT